jgi:putative methionine-R-sulfoxide reductase with GAF domain
MNKGLVILFFFLAIALYSHAQRVDEIQFVRYTKQEGLSHDFINCIAQDSVGYIWLGTPLGLNRYNGTAFVQFHTTKDSLSLPSEDLKGMVWLDKHRLAIYTAGLHIVDTRTGITRNLFIPYHDKRYQWKFNIVMTVKGDDNGNIFLLTRSGFYHYDKNYDLVYRFDYYKDEEVPSSHFFFGNVFGGDLYEFDSKRLLIISAGGLYLYDKEKKEFKKMTARDHPLMSEFLNYPKIFSRFFQPKPGCFVILKSQSDSLVYIDLVKNEKIVSKLPLAKLGSEFHYRSKLVLINDTIMYITGHNSGFYKMLFYPESGAIKFYPEKYFSSFLCNDILKDKDNNLWIATNKGLFHQDADRSQVQINEIPARISDSIPNIRINDIKIMGEKIYVSTYGFDGLFIFDKKTFQFYQQLGFKKDPPASSFVNSIIPADNSAMLLGTGGFIYSLDVTSKHFTKIIPEKWEEGDWTSEFYKDRKGYIWMGCNQVYRYDPNVRKFILQPKDLYNRILRTNSFSEDTAGNIWLAGQGLCRYNTRIGRVDRLIDTLPFIKMPNITIAAVKIDKENNIWFSSYNNGLICYNIDKGSFHQFTRNEGLPDDNITSLIIIDNKLWIATNSGIACMDLLTMQIIRFGKEDGFPNLPIIGGAKFFYDSSAQQLYLGFSNAITRFNPYQLLQKKRPPSVFIENISINAQKNYFLPGNEITTSWRNNDIRINIGTINFSNGPTELFAYRIIKDYQTSWEQLGSQPDFTISNLSPGRYRIQVKAFSLYNRWPEQISEMSITVLPPFWKTNWFIIIATALVLTLAYFFISWRTGRARKKEMEKTHVEKIKADHYKNQFELEQISNYFSSSLADKKTEEEVLWDVTNNLIGRMNYEDCMIYLWNEGKTKMIQKAAYGPKGNPEMISEQVFDVLPGQGIVGQVMQTRQPLLVNDTRLDHRYRVDDEFRLSEVCVPIIHDDELMGILDSEHHLPNYFSERDIKILTTIATLIGNKLKQIESEQSLDANRKELATINEQLVEARLAALQAQMNPHFVFNALNSIKRMILDGDNDKASRYLSKFALMIRMTLNHSKDIFVTLDENVEYLNTYLEMERLRFDDSFTYSILTGENIEVAETLIPSMMIQPLVENAIWHGLLPAENEKKILISFAQHDNRIVCTVEDNGIGFRESEKLKKINNTNSVHHSMGLENLQKRVRIMNEKYDMDCSLKITDLKETGIGSKGTRVVLQFNLINA